MATSFSDLAVAAAVNITLMFLFLVLYSIFSRQPVNSRVFFGKWFILDEEAAASKLEGVNLGHGRKKKRQLNLNVKNYLHAADWLKNVLFMPELELLEHAGLDSVLLIRCFSLGFKMFAPMIFLGFAVLVPLNVTSNELKVSKHTIDNFTYADMDTISISNIYNRSKRLWVHAALVWIYTLWVWFLLHREYKAAALLRLNHLADVRRRPEQFTVLVRQVPPVPNEGVAEHVDHFFHVNHRDSYLFNQVVYNANSLAALENKHQWTVNKLTEISIYIEKHPQKARPQHKLGFLGCCGQKVDSEEHYEAQLADLKEKIGVERKRVLSDPKRIMPASFVSFRSRWGAAVAAQTQQSSNSALWITDWAPEPRDILWHNLPIPYVELTGRTVLVSAAVFALVLFYVIPISFVQGLADLESLQKNIPGLRALTKGQLIQGLLQGYLPGLTLKLVLLVLPSVLSILSTLEGWVSRSTVERKAAGKFFYFMVVNVFLANVLTGSIFSQFKALIKSPTQIPHLFGSAIPMKASFFMTYTMVDAWVGLSVEILRPFSLILYHVRSALMVRTPRDRIKAMNVKGVPYKKVLPQLELYFLLGLVYSAIAPLLLPFIIVFFSFGYLVYRNQVINVYEPEYETAGGFWPHIHGRIVVGQVIQLVTLIGLFSIKKAVAQTACLVPLPFLAIAFHFVYCKGPFEKSFKAFSLEEANKKDELDTVREPLDSIRTFLHNAYLHPMLRKALEKDKFEEELQSKKFQHNHGGPPLVPLKRYPNGQTHPPLPPSMGESGREIASGSDGELSFRGATFWVPPAGASFDSQAVGCAAPVAGTRAVDSEDEIHVGLLPTVPEDASVEIDGPAGSNLQEIVVNSR